jgi:hypothetical protein
LKGVARLRKRRGSTFQIVNLGGLSIRRGNELVAWIEERRQAGIVGFHTSLAGYGETHDRWNGRVGDFDYQTAILRLGGERGHGAPGKAVPDQEHAAAFRPPPRHPRRDARRGAQPRRQPALLRGARQPLRRRAPDRE